MTELFHELEGGLADLLQSGLDTCASASAPRFHALALQCEERGLHTGRALVEELEQALSRREHSMVKEDAKITALICRILQYTALCREKWQEESILMSWQGD